MRAKINDLWQRASRIGLRPGEGVLEKRDVVFLNRILVIMPVLLIGYLPFEIMLNGFVAIHLVIIFIAGLMLPLVFNHYRLFAFARYYSFIIGLLFIAGAGLQVGRGINNHVALIALVLMGIILFHTPWERMLALGLTAGTYLMQQALFDVVEPSIHVPEDIKPAFSRIFFLLAMVVNFVLGYYFIGLNREYESVVVQQKEALADKNKEITDSINYARRIQLSILPPDRVLREALDCFVHYRPKDIVAGDFYWLQNTADGVLFAAADCTGHGVPGAMVSVVCNNALNRCVVEHRLTDPAKILDRASDIVIAEFAKSEEVIRDGMDISLCAINVKRNEIRWAGANNPLIVISNGILHETRPDKQPVGNHAHRQPFTAHSVPVGPGDMVYIFTDGFADQFGGPKGKKFKYSAFKDLLLSIHRLPLGEQKARLEEVFVEWKGSLEQVDDVCLIGARI